jgi:hypothetical protein
LRLKTISYALLLLPLFAGTCAWAQAKCTASAPLDISFFGGLSTASLGVAGARETALTTAVDIAVRQVAGFHPSFEVRAMQPLSSGQALTESSLLGGLRLNRTFGKVQPYADFLFGRAQLQYENGGITVPQTNVVYTQSAGNVYSAGGGVSIEVSQRISIRADAQFQLVSSPVVSSKRIDTVPFTIGVVYHLPSTQRGHAFP